MVVSVMGITISNKSIPYGKIKTKPSLFLPKYNPSGIDPGILHISITEIIFLTGKLNFYYIP